MGWYRVGNHDEVLDVTLNYEMTLVDRHNNNLYFTLGHNENLYSTIIIPMPLRFVIETVALNINTHRLSLFLWLRRLGQVMSLHLNQDGGDLPIHRYIEVEDLPRGSALILYFLLFVVFLFLAFYPSDIRFLCVKGCHRLPTWFPRRLIPSCERFCLKGKLPRFFVVRSI